MQFFENGHDNISPCKCIAHKAIDSFFKDSKLERDRFCQLIRIPTKMNNDNGKTFILNFISMIFQYSTQNELMVSSTEHGTEWTVNFMLMDIGTSEFFSFRPDFCLTDKTVGAGVMLITIGELESRLGDCFAQLGSLNPTLFHPNDWDV